MPQVNDDMPRLLIVIVNYRTAKMTIECLETVESQVRDRPWRVAVVDNASGDGSVEQLTEAVRRRGWSDWVTLMPQPRNGGFAYGNNAAIRPALASDRPPDFVLLLNSDTLVRPGAFDALVQFMQRRPDVGIAGSRLENPDGSVRRSAFRFASLWSELEQGARFGPLTRLLDRHVVAPPMREDEHPVDWVAGASMIIRREVFEQTGLMDEGYFLYYEETDFCLRARRQGWPCWYVPSSRVVHLCGQSSGVTRSQRGLRPLPRYWFDSRRRYFTRNHGRAYAVAADVCWFVGTLLHRLRLIVSWAPRHDPPRMLRDLLRYSLWANLTRS